MLWHMSHSVDQMQQKTQHLEKVAVPIGLQINKDKTKIMRMKTNSSQTVSIYVLVKSQLSIPSDIQF